MRLIDADALKDKLLNAIECGHRVDMPTSELEAVLNDVKTAPSIDIVHCRECICWRADKWFCTMWKVGTPDDGFCYMGKTENSSEKPNNLSDIPTGSADTQTYITEDRDTRILDAWQVKHMQGGKE